jgi:hypothetical protein
MPLRAPDFFVSQGCVWGPLAPAASCRIHDRAKRLSLDLIKKIWQSRCGRLPSRAWRYARPGLAPGRADLRDVWPTECARVSREEGGLRLPRRERDFSCAAVDERRLSPYYQTWDQKKDCEGRDRYGITERRIKRARQAGPFRDGCDQSKTRLLGGHSLVREPEKDAAMQYSSP